jgi:hypothetical protein
MRLSPSTPAPASDIDEQSPPRSVEAVTKAFTGIER